MIVQFGEPVRYYYKFERNNAPHEYSNIDIGDIFKVGRSNERFWVVIVGRCSTDRYVVRVDNTLVNRQPFNNGDILIKPTQVKLF
jgi:hypothetical protein